MGKEYKHRIEMLIGTTEAAYTPEAREIKVKVAGEVWWRFEPGVRVGAGFRLLAGDQFSISIGSTQTLYFVAPVDTQIAIEWD